MSNDKFDDIFGPLGSGGEAAASKPSSSAATHAHDTSGLWGEPPADTHSAQSGHQSGFGAASAFDDTFDNNFHKASSAGMTDSFHEPASHDPLSFDQPRHTAIEHAPSVSEFGDGNTLEMNAEPAAADGDEAPAQRKNRWSLGSKTATQADSTNAPPEGAPKKNYTMYAAGGFFGLIGLGLAYVNVIEPMMYENTAPPPPAPAVTPLPPKGPVQVPGGTSGLPAGIKAPIAPSGGQPLPLPSASVPMGAPTAIPTLTSPPLPAAQPIPTHPSTIPSSMPLPVPTSPGPVSPPPTGVSGASPSAMMNGGAPVLTLPSEKTPVLPLSGGPIANGEIPNKMPGMVTGPVDEVNTKPEVPKPAIKAAGETAAERDNDLTKAMEAIDRVSNDIGSMRTLVSAIERRLSSLETKVVTAPASTPSTQTATPERSIPQKDAKPVKPAGHTEKPQPPRRHSIDEAKRERQATSRTGGTAYELRAAIADTVWVRPVGGGDGDMRRVRVGDDLPGWGQVRGIQQTSSGGWIVRTDKGVIQ